MIDDEFIERRPDDLEVYRRLDAFAQVRLAPDPAAMARIRSALMGQALALADGRATVGVQVEPATPMTERPSLVLRRPHISRTSAAFLAACLTLGVAAGSVAASTAGGPLYGPRLWLEDANLPHASMARATAQLDRLDLRLAEIRTASWNGNVGAAEAALSAYGAIVGDLQEQARAEPGIGLSVLDDVARRQLVLTALLDAVPPQAQDALAYALEQGANAVEVMGAEDGNPGDPVGGGGGKPATHEGHGSGAGSGAGSGDRSGSAGSGSGSGSGGGSGGSGGSGSGNSGQGTQGGAGNGGNPPGQDPDRTPKPARSPKPTPTPRQPALDPTPATRATPVPNPSGGDEQGADGGETGSSRQDASGGSGSDGDSD